MLSAEVRRNTPLSLYFKILVLFASFSAALSNHPSNRAAWLCIPSLTDINTIEVNSVEQTSSKLVNVMTEELNANQKQKNVKNNQR